MEIVHSINFWPVAKLNCEIELTHIFHEINTSMWNGYVVEEYIYIFCLASPRSIKPTDNGMDDLDDVERYLARPEYPHISLDAVMFSRYIPKIRHCVFVCVRNASIRYSIASSLASSSAHFWDCFERVHAHNVLQPAVSQPKQTKNDKIIKTNNRLQRLWIQLNVQISPFAYIGD